MSGASVASSRAKESKLSAPASVKITGAFAWPGCCLREHWRRDANEAIGKAKQGVGEAVGSDRLKGEGVIQEAKGHGQQALGDAKAAAKEAVDKAANYAHRKL